jgi:hypothetical protein
LLPNITIRDSERQEQNKGITDEKFITDYQKAEQIPRIPLTLSLAQAGTIGGGTPGSHLFGLLGQLLGIAQPSSFPRLLPIYIGKGF